MFSEHSEKVCRVLCDLGTCDTLTTPAPVLYELLTRNESIVGSAWKTEDGTRRPVSLFTENGTHSYLERYPQQQWWQKTMKLLTVFHHWKEQQTPALHFSVPPGINSPVK